MNARLVCKIVWCQSHRAERLKRGQSIHIYISTCTVQACVMGRLSIKQAKKGKKSADITADQFRLAALRVLQVVC